MNNVGKIETGIILRLRKLRESIELSPIEDEVLENVEHSLIGAIKTKNMLAKKDGLLLQKYPEIHREIKQAYIKRYQSMEDE